MKTVKIQQIRTITIPCNTDDVNSALNSVLAEWDDNHTNLVDEDFDEELVLVRVTGEDSVIVHSCKNRELTHQIVEPLP